jgi:hypothetical protein
MGAVASTLTARPLRAAEFVKHITESVAEGDYFAPKIFNAAETEFWKKAYTNLSGEEKKVALGQKVSRQAHIVAW